MKKKYKTMSNGLGVVNWIKRVLSVKKNTWGFGILAFKSLVLQAPLSKIPVIGTLFKSLIMFTNKRTTQGYSIPLNIDVSSKIKPVTVPIDIMKQAVQESMQNTGLQ
jgi:hypothetical protein